MAGCFTITMISSSHLTLSPIFAIISHHHYPCQCLIITWSFPEIGVPPNYPFLDGMFPNKNQPFCGTSQIKNTSTFPHFFVSPHGMIFLRATWHQDCPPPARPPPGLPVAAPPAQSRARAPPRSPRGLDDCWSREEHIEIYFFWGHHFFNPLLFF